MDEKFAILRKGPNYNLTDGHGYNTLKQAADDGAVVMAYGQVLCHLYDLSPYTNA
jgi:large conductance mechanosensitive channel